MLAKKHAASETMVVRRHGCLGAGRPSSSGSGLSDGLGGTDSGLGIAH